MADSEGQSGWIVFLGVAIGIFSAVSSNLGTNTQKYGFMNESRRPVHERRSYQQQPLWWIGFILVILGGIGDLLSFSLAPQSLVAPTGSFTLVSNVFFARVWLGEELTQRDIIGTVLVVAGALISVSFGSHEETAYSIEQLQELYLQPAMAVYGLFILALWAALLLVIRRSETLLRASLAGAAALEEAMSVHSGGSDTNLTPHATTGSTTADKPASSSSAAVPDSSGDDDAQDLAGHTPLTDEADPSSSSTEETAAPTTSHPGPAALEEDDDDEEEAEAALVSAKDGDEAGVALTISTPSESGGLSAVASDSQSVKGKQMSKQAVELAQLTAGLREPPPEYAAYARWHPLAYAGLAGSIGGQTVMFAKSVGEIVKATAAGSNQFEYFFTYVILVCMLACMIFEQHFLASSLQLFDALLVVPVFSSAFMLVTVLGGAAYFDELSSFTALSWVLFPLGILLTVAGVLVLSSRKQTGTGEAKELLPDSSEDEETGTAPPGKLATGDSGDGQAGEVELIAIPSPIAEADDEEEDDEDEEEAAQRGDKEEQAGDDDDDDEQAQNHPAIADHDDDAGSDGTGVASVLDVAISGAVEATTAAAPSSASSAPPTTPPHRPQTAQATPPRADHRPAGPESASPQARRPSLLRPEWQAVLATRPQGLAALLPLSGSSPQQWSGSDASPGATEPSSSSSSSAAPGAAAAAAAAAATTAEARSSPPPPPPPLSLAASRQRRPRSSTDVPAAAPSSSSAGGRQPRRRSILDTTLSLLHAVTVSKTMVSAFDERTQPAAPSLPRASSATAVRRPRAATAELPRASSSSK